MLSKDSHQETTYSMRFHTCFVRSNGVLVDVVVVKVVDAVLLVLLLFAVATTICWRH